MNRSQLIWAIICLILAALLAVLNVALPADKLMFTVGDRNLPWVPPLVLGVLGIVLLVTAGRRGQEATQAGQPQTIDEEKAALNKRLETIGWGCFLVMVGGFALVPREAIE